MPSINRHIAIAGLYVLLALSTAPAAAQIRDLGVMGGTGVGFLPTTSFTPESHFSLNVARFSMLRNDGRGLTNTSISGGLTDGMEITAMFRSGETGGDLSQASFGVTAKLQSPLNLPFTASTVLWGGSISTTSQATAAFYPPTLTHAGVISEPRFLNAISPKSLKRPHAGIVLGISAANGTTGLLAGVDFSYPLNEHFKLGTEVVHNYFGMTDWMETVTAIWTPNPYIGLQLNPGVFQVNGNSSMTVSFGITFSTTAIEFLQPLKIEDEDKVPSFDDLQNQINEERKDAGKQDKQ